MSRAEMRAVSGVRGKPAVIASGAIMLALFIVLAMVAFAIWPTADDYCNSVLVAEHGVGGALHWLFFEWSGRVVSGVPLYLTFALIDLPSLHWMSVALVFLFAVAAFQVGSLIAGDDLPLKWPLCAFTFAAFVLGLYRLLGQAVLWSTGGIVYMLPLVISLAWLASTRALLEGKAPRGGAAYGFVLGILAGNSIELVWPILVAYLALVAPPRWKAISPAARRALVARTVGLALGMLLLIVAPGNYARAKVTPGSFTLEPSFLAGRYGEMLREIASIAWPMTALVGAIALLSWLAWHHARRAGKTRPELSPLREAIALAIGALASVVPVLAAPPQFAPRNGFYLLIFAFTAAMIPLASCARHARWRPIAAPSLIGLAALGAIVISIPLLADARQSSAFRDRQLARDRSLRQFSQSGIVDAVVPSVLQEPVPRTLHFVELDPNPAQWNNVCMAKYYRLRSIALEPKAR